MKKRIIIRIIAIALAVIMIIGMLLAFDLNNVEAGESLSDCGANLSVSVGGDPVTLTIEVKDPSWNNGLMDNFSYGAGIDDFPWADYRDQIQIIEIKNGVTKISNNAFRDMPNLTTVVIPSSFTSTDGWIGMNAFTNCPQLYGIYYDGTEDWWNGFKGAPGAIDGTNTVLLNSNVRCLNRGVCYMNLAPGRVDVYEMMGSYERSCFATALNKMREKGIVNGIEYLPEYDGMLLDISNDGAGDIILEVIDGTEYVEVWPEADLTGSYLLDLGMEGNDELYGLSRFGAIEFSFPTDLTYAAVSLKPDSPAYTGNKLTPKETVKLCGKTLKKGIDYTVVSYSDNQYPGYATVKVKGKGKYTGTGYGSFLVCFKDVPASHSYSKSVYWALGRGIAAGYSGAKTGTFGVSDNVTRGQVIMFLWRAAGQMEPINNTQTFKDVPTTHNYYKAIQWASDYGLTSGFADGTFRPSKPCTRGQIAVFLWHFAGSPKPLDFSEPFSDVPLGHNYYYAVKWAHERGIASGYSDGTFGVSKNCTRGHCVTFMYRLMRTD